jgi:hypothetical protein
VRDCRPLELLEAYILKLCAFLHPEGRAGPGAAGGAADAEESDEGEDDADAGDRAARRANQEIRRAKVRRLRRQLEGGASRAQALQLLERASWDVEKAAEIARGEPQWAGLREQGGAAGGGAGGGDAPADATAKAAELAQKLYNTVRPGGAGR